MLSVERAVSTYVVPREHRAAGDLRRRADRVLRERVPAVLPALMEESFAGDAVWLVERIDVDFAFAADALDDDALARLWSEQILLGLGSAVRAGEGILHFSSRAALIARYVADVAAGRAGDRWYYAQFASLAALPVASILREAITREPSNAFAVIAELARMRRLRFVVDALSTRGLAEVWETAFPGTGAVAIDPSAEIIQSLLAAWSRLTTRRPLHLAAVILEERPVEPEPLRVHVEALLAFAKTLEEAADAWSLVEAIIDGDASAAIAHAASRGAIPDLAALAFFTRLASTHPAVVTCVAGTLRSSSNVMATHSRSVEGELVPTRFAALAMLLPVLADLDLLASEAAAPLRAVIAARCAGDGTALDDPIVRLFAGDEVECDLGPREQLVTTLAAIAVLKSFAARLPGFAKSSFAHLRKNFLAGMGTIRFDGERIDVELPPLPLALVLRIAGMHGQTFTVPWLPERTIALRLPEGS